MRPARAAGAFLALLALPGASRGEPAQPAGSEMALLVVAEAEAEAGEIAWLPARRGPFSAPAGTRELSWLAPGASPQAPPVPAQPGRVYARLGVRARAPGHFDVDLGGAIARVDAVEVRALDHRGAPVSPRTSHASLSRSLPSELGSLPGEDRDALSFLLISPPSVDLEAIEVLTRSEAGQALDVLPKLRPAPGVCPEGTPPELVCRRTAAVRLVGDALDSEHPAARDRSLRAELGGTLRLSSAGRALIELQVGGPRETRLGPIERLRASLRPLVLRARAGGAPALGGDDATAKRLLSRELRAAAALWAQCGVDFGPLSEQSIQVVGVPPVQLLSVGCSFGQVASGGSLQVQYGRASVRLSTRAGEQPLAVARRLADALGGAGVSVSVFENRRAASARLPSADLVLEGTAPPGGVQALSSDPSLPVCVGQVDLEDGLDHFGDGDAFVGTLEERALLRAFDDGDPRTIEVLVVPSFARAERIGESFISSPGSSLTNTVIVDRSAIVAGARSFALAHELGHVLLAMPGHPDDFGTDQSWSLMDADVADSTVFGPRRLSISDCERAVAQTGPGSPVPLLSPVPFR